MTMNKPVRTREQNKARRASRAVSPKTRHHTAQSTHASSGKARRKARQGERRMA